MVTLENPIGLYFDSFKPVNFVTPDGSDAETFWTWTRGTPGRYLRGVFEVNLKDPTLSQQPCSYQ